MAVQQLSQLLVGVTKVWGDAKHQVQSDEVHAFASEAHPETSRNMSTCVGVEQAMNIRDSLHPCEGVAGIRLYELVEIGIDFSAIHKGWIV